MRFITPPQITCASAQSHLPERENPKITFSLKFCISRERYGSWTVLQAKCCLRERKIVICNVSDSV